MVFFISLWDAGLTDLFPHSQPTACFSSFLGLLAFEHRKPEEQRPRIINKLWRFLPYRGRGRRVDSQTWVEV